MPQALILPIILVAIAALMFNKLSKKHARLPPGPPADPIIGHLRFIPSVGQDVFYYELGKTYGDVVHLKVLGQALIVLNSGQAAVDLLDKRGSIYSSRPRLPIMELIGMGDTLAFLPYGNEFRTQRRMTQQYFTKAKIVDHRPIQTREARILVNGLRSQPDSREELLVRFSTAIIMEIAYGYRITSNDDPYIKMATDSSRAAVGSGPLGATAVDLFPILKHFPSWFPGTYYATFARAAKPLYQKFLDIPVDRVQEQIMAGSARPSFVLSQLESLDPSDPESSIRLQHIKRASAILYGAGAETTSSTLSFFLLAMVLYPEYQTRAQKELDAVVGTGRLPEFNDREHLPFIECLLQETLRWNPAIPMGIPHCALENGVYNGMLIPKGATILANTRGITWDESVYRDPFSFNPTRFLTEPEGQGEPYPMAAFGFGRRICPGRFLAEDSIWIAITTTLATLVVSRVRGEDGEEIIPEVVPVSSGVANHPQPFSCRLEARNTIANVLLGSEYNGGEQAPSDKL